MEPKTLSDMTIMEMKAAIYDQMVVSEQCQQNIKVLNEEIKRRPPLNGIQSVSHEKTGPLGIVPKE